MTFRQALQILEARQETRIELGLTRFREHLKSLGNTHLKLRCFHVAGTNGKGAVCAILDSVLRAAGYNTGLYISPHLFDIRERISVAGRSISKEAFARLLERALHAARGLELTYFELITSIALQYFSEQNVDAAVIETGLGGRLDATNVFAAPLAVVISSLDFDHMNFLGDNLAAIAGEKAGIIKAKSPIFCPALPSAALAVIRARAEKVRAPLTVVRRSWETIGIDMLHNRQRLRDPDGRQFTLHLLGAGQGRNVALAYAAVQSVSAAFPVSTVAWRRGLAGVLWPGRFEVLHLGGKTAVIDGGHNPEAAAHLRRTWEATPWARQKKRSRWILGILKDKDVVGVIRALAPALDDVVTVRPDNPRALEPHALAVIIRRFAPRARVTVADDVAAAIRVWRDDPYAPCVAMIAGSFYLAGRAAHILKAWRVSHDS